MDNNKSIGSTILDGLYAVLPLVILILIFTWLWHFLVYAVQPLISLITLGDSKQTFFSELSAFILALFILFVIGSYIKSPTGRHKYRFLENKFLKKIPGYSGIKETVTIIVGRDTSSFSKVALVNTYNTELQQIGFITDEHIEGYTVFIPTSPNPTSGNIVILPKSQVHIIDVPIDVAMRSIVSCGAVSNIIVKGLKD